MHKSKSIDYKKLRKEVSKLFFDVLNNNISVREALRRFPKNCDDPTIITSWHALCHYESDEDIRKKDSLYKEEQDNYIRFIANTLFIGDELPQNIINSYKKYHHNALMPSDNSIKGIIYKFKRFLCFDIE